MRHDSVSDADLRLQMDEGFKDLKRQLNTARQDLVEYRKAHGSIKAQLDAVLDEVKTLPVPKQAEIVKTKKVSASSPVELCLLFCDWHYGGIQDKNEIENFGEFSPEICEARIESLITRVVNWTNLHRYGYKIDTVNVLCAGDLISGDIHQELQVTNSFPAPVQTVRVAALLAKSISELSRHFKSVVVHFVTEDNHARLTKKPQAKEAGINSFNYIVGEMARMMVSNHNSVMFKIYPMFQAVVEVMSRRYLLTHGHGVSGWLGFPYYGIERRVAKEATKRMNAPDLTRFNKVVMGHWHAPIDHPIFMIGGSVSGTDAYDHKCGRFANASQKAWFVHPKYGDFDKTDFVLD